MTMRSQYAHPRLNLAVFALFVAASAASGQDSRFEFPGVSAGVRDTAQVFSPEAVRNAKADIDRIERETNASLLIETVETVGQESVKTAAAANAKRWGREGIYVLIDKKDHRFEVLPTTGLDKAVTREDVEVFRDAFLTQFKRGKFDDGLRNGVQAMGLTLSVAARDGKLGRLRERRAGGDTFSRLAQGATHGGSALVVRNQARLSLGGARLIVAGAQAKAAELKLKANVAVVDDGGHLLSFDRMDGARPASVYTALTKATSAATFRSETGAAPKTPGNLDAAHQLGEVDVVHQLSLQHAAAISGGKITSLNGGVPVIVDGQVIGGVGVGGGTGDQDSTVARAGIERFLSALKLEADGK